MVDVLCLEFVLSEINSYVILIFENYETNLLLENQQEAGQSNEEEAGGTGGTVPQVAPQVEGTEESKVDDKAVEEDKTEGEGKEEEKVEEQAQEPKQGNTEEQSQSAVQTSGANLFGGEQTKQAHTSVKVHAPPGGVSSISF
jgi:hypothetical protein